MSENRVLTESGTNELEVVEFTLGSNYYGINVAKVSRLLNILDLEVTPFPRAPNSVRGVSNYRGTIIPIIDLFMELGIENKSGNEMLLITEFSNRIVGFIVGDVKSIRRETWADVEPMSSFLIDTSGPMYVTGVIKGSTGLITMLDFETIISTLLGTGKFFGGVTTEHSLDTSKKVIFAEDSTMVSKVLKDNLLQVGFTDILSFTNGLDAWEYIEQLEKADIDNILCLISDIEMPKLDGLSLTKRIKDDPELKEIPVVLFSSLITDALRNKGESVGADLQISKPDMQELVIALTTVSEIRESI